MSTVMDAPGPWALDADAVAKVLATDTDRGLTHADAVERLERVGPNELTERRRPGPWRLFVAQFTNTMTMVLAAAAVVTFAIGEYTDTAVIAAIVVLNAIVGFVQEHRAEQAMEALARLTVTNAHVVRDGVVRQVPAAQLVPGDMVLLAAGDLVPADLRLAEVHGLRVDEAALTGESEPSAKTVAPLHDVGRIHIADQQNMAFNGTAATYGRARGIVVATGMSTEVGRIAGLLQESADGSTPLQRRLAALGRRLAAAAVAVCAVVFTGGVISGEPVAEMFLTAVSLAVAAIPEGLPAVVTVALALGARRMAARRALVRRLAAVEALGSVTVICSDKTGTLTENRMLVERIWTPAGEYTVTGSGYGTDGVVSGVDTEMGGDEFLGRLAWVAAACNDATLHAPAGPADEWTISGDPTEGALLALAAKLGVERTDVDVERPRHAEIGFDAARRRMTTAHRVADGSWIAVKGALAALTPLLTDDGALIEQADAAAEQLADEGYRVLALAERTVATLPEHLDDLEQDLHLLGLVAIADPPRAEARDAIAKCRGAGITPVMITGDHPRTARAIARRLGLLDDGDDAVLTGTELAELDDDALAERAATIRVYARTSPEQKVRIVAAWKALGAVVAMTGDGVNDAPALRQADIGVAMGVTGTDVSKEAADMILADDDFATIVGAVEEGRRIYDNVRRFVRYMLATNSGEIWVMFLAPVFGLPLPLIPVQILFINLLSDGLPAVALGLEPAEAETMARPPRPPTESILAKGLWQQALWLGLLMAAVVIPLQAASRAAGWPWQTMVFTTLSFLQLGHALAVRSEQQSFFRLGVRSNPWVAGAVAVSAVAQLATVYVPWLQNAFDTTALSPVQLTVVVVASTAVFMAVEIEKWIRQRPRRRPRHDGSEASSHG